MSPGKPDGDIQEVVGCEDLEFNRHCNAGFDLFTEVLKVVALSRKRLRYLNRFSSELEQIELRNSFKDRQGRRHCSREAAIRQTLERERRQYQAHGLDSSSSACPKAKPSFSPKTGSFCAVRVSVRDITTRPPSCRHFRPHVQLISRTHLASEDLRCRSAARARAARISALPSRWPPQAALCSVST
ncbi:unnamed protein product [Rangifer tarandus platyrhynchus]|uniref:Translation machinery-associated protein 16 n=1 Tax=Rangifer tarandus platyrhynchus TaxID=3082113 RepID=A0ABN8Y9S3_RANTA|nr:unnamed protein product [Rangifer tarandus platyrhynchus]